MHERRQHWVQVALCYFLWVTRSDTVPLLRNSTYLGVVWNHHDLTFAVAVGQRMHTVLEVCFFACLLVPCFLPQQMCMWLCATRWWYQSGMAWGKLACAGGRGGGGGIRAPQRKGGGGAGKGALVTGLSQEASLKPLMMTHQLRREAAWGFFPPKTNSPVIHTSK